MLKRSETPSVPFVRELLSRQSEKHCSRLGMMRLNVSFSVAFKCVKLEMNQTRAPPTALNPDSARSIEVEDDFHPQQATAKNKQCVTEPLSLLYYFFIGKFHHSESDGETGGGGKNASNGAHSVFTFAFSAVLCPRSDSNFICK